MQNHNIPPEILATITYCVQYELDERSNKSADGEPEHWQGLSAAAKWLEAYENSPTKGQFADIIPADLPKFDPDLDVDGYEGKINNGTRADRAQTALDCYIGTDRPDVSHLQDLLGDLMHLAHRDGLNYAEALDLAHRNFIAESNG